VTSNRILSNDEIRLFDRDGAVTIEGPFSQEEIEAAGAVMDRLIPTPPPPLEPYARGVLANEGYDSALLTILQHPFLEQNARQILRTERVELHSVFLNKAFPTPGEPFNFWQHVDIKYTNSDIDSTPRRMLCTQMIWLTDVTMENAPFMYRPVALHGIRAHPGPEGCRDDF